MRLVRAGFRVDDHLILPCQALKTSCVRATYACGLISWVCLALSTASGHQSKQRLRPQPVGSVTVRQGNFFGALLNAFILKGKLYTSLYCKAWDCTA